MTIILVLLAGVLALAVAAVMLARASSPTQSVNQLLYETEHPVSPTAVPVVGRTR